MNELIEIEESPRPNPDNNDSTLQPLELDIES
jgi:hypothetical protein